MALRAIVVRGLATHEVRILHMAQSESGDDISLTLIVEDPDPLS